MLYRGYFGPEIKIVITKYFLLKHSWGVRLYIVLITNQQLLVASTFLLDDDFYYRHNVSTLSYIFLMDTSTIDKWVHIVLPFAQDEHIDVP